MALVKRRADIADLAWGPGFMLIAWASLILGQATIYGLIVNSLVTLWAIRLASHIYVRNHNREEDFRYQALKKKWKNDRFNLFFEVFLLQGAILYVVALPIVWIHTHPEGISYSILWMALPLWLSGFAMEALADRQLAIFKKNPSNKGQLLTRGLWSYSRHPNYLGELIQWWAIWLMAAFLPYGWALLISPLLLTFLIVKVSGIKPLEEKWLKNGGFNEYIKNTPSLIPASFVNGILYGISWFVLVSYGHQHSALLSTLTLLSCFTAQFLLFYKYDAISLRIGFPLAISAWILGLLLEVAFIHLRVLAYPNNEFFPPLWILALYPLFSLTLNSSLKFLNKSLLLSFFLGGFGALFSYFSGESLGAVQLFVPRAYPVIVVFWGVFLTLLIVLNRYLNRYFSHG